MSDDAAFLRAIASDPADDTVRLAYADFLEETGEPAHAARAEFTRTQIEARSLHLNHPRRADLEARAAELFAEHWVEWWLPVCAAVGLPLPHLPARGFRERFGRLLRRPQPDRGAPYELTEGTTLGWVRTPAHEREVAPPLRGVVFERGFPQWLDLIGQLTDAAMPVRRWTTVAPLTVLQLRGTVARDWKLIDGEHLRGVRELRLGHAAATAVAVIGASPHLPRLEELTLRPDRSNIAWPAEQYRAFAESPLAGRVKWLHVVVGAPDEVAALDGPHLANLAGLHVEGAASLIPDREDVARVAGLLASPHLTGLKELTLTGAACLALGPLPGRLAAGLRRLVVNAGTFATGLVGLLRDDALPAVTDLCVSSGAHALGVHSVLANSPLAGRLRHLRLAGGWAAEPDTKRELLRLARVLDPGRLETLALDRQLKNWPEVWDEFQTRFPGRVSAV
jgi:uncharacterized protein (TIGR02996 family)